MLNEQGARNKHQFSFLNGSFWFRSLLFDPEDEGTTFLRNVSTSTGLHGALLMFNSIFLKHNMSNWVCSWSLFEARAFEHQANNQDQFQ
jgi:hypothetical protein